MADNYFVNRTASDNDQRTSPIKMAADYDPATETYTPRVSTAGGASGGLTDAQLRATPVPVIDNNSGPASHAAAVTKSDSTVLTTTRALFVGGAGDVAVTMAAGGNVTFTAVTAGTTIPIAVTKVLSTGTSATNIVALW